MRHSLYALVDCNNFFVSCERVFRPDLENKPLVVLSSNDGCVIARSNEAKSLGIPMGAPAHKYRQLFKERGVIQFSVNFDLYGSISKRITALLMTITPFMEVYSVDESFLDLKTLLINDYEIWGRQVRKLIWEGAGIPVSIGIAPTKTLAKLASERAKKIPELNGVLDLTQIGTKAYSNHLNAVSINDVWGVGRHLAPKLRIEGIGTAWQLRNLRPQRAQQLMGIHGRQMVSELQGTDCYPLTAKKIKPKSIAATRTFGEDTNDYYVIKAAIVSFIAKATLKLRESNQSAGRISVFLTTNKHKPGYQTWSKEIVFRTPLADIGLIASVLTHSLKALYNADIYYHRGGVILYDLRPLQLQLDIQKEISLEKHLRSQSRMAALDNINYRFGKKALHYAAEDLANNWQPRQQLRSPAYLSKWDELPRLHIR